MGTGLIGKSILICGECGYHINKVKDLVKGSADPTDVRCPDCGSSSFQCGFCLRMASKFAFNLSDLTWDCTEGCNP